MGALGVVVDIRYHLASLVAVFLSLGLGILIGTSLSGGEGVNRREEWLASLERELEQIQTRRSQASVRLVEVEKERDVYAQFAASVSAMMLRDTLTNETAGIVLLGEDREVLQLVQGLFLDAGATVSRVAHVKPTWNERTDHFLTLLTPNVSDQERVAGALLAHAIIGSNPEFFNTIDSPALWLQANSSRPPTVVSFVITDYRREYMTLFEQAVEELLEADVHTVVVVPDGNEQWQKMAERRGLPFVGHVSSPIGRISLVHLVSQKEGGSYGYGASLLPWPESLFGGVTR